MSLNLRLYIVLVFIVLIPAIQHVESSCSIKCYNNGTCVTVLDLFSWCLCTESYRGAYCEQCTCFMENKTCSYFGTSICLASNKNVSSSNLLKDSSEKYALVVFLSILSPFMICICCSLIGFCCVSIAYWRKSCADFFGFCSVKTSDQSINHSHSQSIYSISTIETNENTSLPFYTDLVRFTINQKTSQPTKPVEQPPSYEEILTKK